MRTLEQSVRKFDISPVCKYFPLEGGGVGPALITEVMAQTVFLKVLASKIRNTVPVTPKRVRHRAFQVATGKAGFNPEHLPSDRPALRCHFKRLCSSHPK